MPEVPATGRKPGRKIPHPDRPVIPCKIKDADYVGFSDRGTSPQPDGPEIPQSIRYVRSCFQSAEIMRFNMLPGRSENPTLGPGLLGSASRDIPAGVVGVPISPALEQGAVTDGVLRPSPQPRAGTQGRQLSPPGGRPQTEA